MSVFASINLPANLFMRQVRSFITLFWWLVEAEVPSTSACFLDGKKHDTKVSETLEDGFRRCRDIVTDNYVITDVQRQAYLGTVTLEQGTGGGIAKAATGFVEEKEGLSLKDITMWRGDSTSTVHTVACLPALIRLRRRPTTELSAFYICGNCYCALWSSLTLALQQDQVHSHLL